MSELKFCIECGEEIGVSLFTPAPRNGKCSGCLREELEDVIGYEP